MEILTFKNSKYLQVEVRTKTTTIDLGLYSVDEVSELIEEFE